MADSSSRPPRPIPAALRHSRLRRRVNRALRWLAALVLLVVGIAGLVLPGIQGVLTLLVSVALVAPDVPAARRLVLILLRRFPALRRRLPKRVRRGIRGDRRDSGEESD